MADIVVGAGDKFSSSNVFQAKKAEILSQGKYNFVTWSGSFYCYLDKPLPAFEGSTRDTTWDYDNKNFREYSLTGYYRADDALIVMTKSVGDKLKPTLAVTVNSCIDQDHATKVLDSLVDEYRYEHPEIPGCKVEFLFRYMSTNGPSSYYKTLDARDWSEISRNYSRSVRDQLDPVFSKKKLLDTDGKLFLMYGPPGTGKTNVIRALSYEWRKWSTFEIIMDPETFLGRADYMTSVMGSSISGHRIIVMEDSGELIAEHARNRSGQGMSRLMNMADGIIGQGQNITFLITTNEDIRRLEPAVTRPGRCLAQVEIGSFTPEEASSWLGKEVSRKMTLADLYAEQNKSLAQLSEDFSDLKTGQYL